MLLPLHEPLHGQLWQQTVQPQPSPPLSWIPSFLRLKTGSRRRISSWLPLPVGVARRFGFNLKFKFTASQHYIVAVWQGQWQGCSGSAQCTRLALLKVLPVAVQCTAVAGLHCTRETCTASMPHHWQPDERLWHSGCHYYCHYWQSGSSTLLVLPGQCHQWQWHCGSVALWQSQWQCGTHWHCGWQ